MSQEVLYRRWRPRRFADVVGQDPVVQTLRNAVSAGTPAHAYLLCGPRGTGKTTTGRILAKALNCAGPVEGEPCDACQSCRDYDDGRALDLIELDAASNRGIDEIRGLRESAGYAPNSGRYKVYLIDEVHMLTDAAFNALLKTLEEPPPHVIFILATTEPHKLPATILSRCQRFDLRRATIDGLVYRLRIIGDGEGFQVADGGYELIAKQGNGAWRDAVNLLDQLVAYHGSNLSLEDVRSGLGLVVDSRAIGLAQAAVEKDLREGLSLIAGARDDGVEMRAFSREVVAVLRKALLIKAGAADLTDLADSQMEVLTAMATQSEVGEIVGALQAFGDLDFRGDAYDSLPTEIAFASLCTGIGAPVAAAAPVPAAPA
ncbi:MAG: DNA polymerase III subunit gamma/tau, partial [Chloroflexi bacterium]|nr:DNA polymerase III subunit gamma/tau [Chloroflexota bacterium]MQC25420.1 DNA polymerase III subunit gamma/tau [Chloroflexota bacterium]